MSKHLYQGKNITFHGFAYPKLTWGLPTLSPTITAPGYLGGGHWATEKFFFSGYDEIDDETIFVAAADIAVDVV